MTKEKLVMIKQQKMVLHVCLIIRKLYCYNSYSYSPEGAIHCVQCVNAMTLITLNWTACYGALEVSMLLLLLLIVLFVWLCLSVATEVTAETSSQCGVIAAASLLPRCQL